MLKVGLTGGIGSGKSTVAKIFAALGIPVYYADKRAKELMSTEPELIKEIISNFSENAYSQGKLDSTFLAGEVFQNKEKLSLLNSIVHPFTIADAKKWMENQSSAYAIKEAALIFESGSQGEFDCIIGVEAPQSLRILRTMKRDQVEREKVLERINNQLEESIKMKLCDYVIINDDQSMIIPQVLAIHEMLLTIESEAKHDN
jgi:dephospho-CoA kinase